MSDTAQPGRISAGRVGTLDGLRAVAFLSVFGYHAEIPGFGGGFLGVDVFFVLSGFLVTRILLTASTADVSTTLGVDTTLDFVARRLRRLMPMLIVVVLATTALVAVAGSDGQLFRQRGEAIATLLSVSNFWAIAEGQSYFAQFVARSPLTPTWTLSIEVQFYVLWSVIALWAARRSSFVRRLAGSAIALTLVSIGVMAFGAFAVDASSTYFNTLARLHEPLLGAILALLMSRDRFRFRQPELLGVMALVVLAASVVFLRNDEPAYYLGGSVAVAVSTCGVVGSVLQAPAGALAKVFSWRPAVGLGRISYSAYLWHWSIIITLSEQRVGFGGAGLWCLWLGTTVAISAVTFRLVELGGVRARLSTARTYVAVGAGIAVSIVVVLIATAGAERDPLDAAAAIVAPDAPADGDRRPRVALIGDSVAQSVLPALTDDAAEHGLVVADGAFPGCPVADLEPLKQDGSPAVANNARCRDQADPVRRQLAEQWDPDVVVWSSTLESGHLSGQDGRVLAPGSPGWRRALRGALEQAYERDVPDGAGLVILVPAPSDDGDDVAAKSAYGDVLAAFAATVPSATVIDLGDVTCEEEPGCRDGRPDRPDGIHYTEESAAIVVESIRSRGVLPTG